MRLQFHKANRKIICIGAVATVLPLIAIPFIRSRSLTGASQEALFQVVWRKEERAIEHETQQNGNAYKTYGEMLARWQVLKGDLVRLGANEQLSTKIIKNDTAWNKKTFPIAHWPVIVRRGWIINRPVWIIVTGFPHKVKSPLRGSQLIAPITRPGMIWSYGTTLYDKDGNAIPYQQR